MNVHVQMFARAKELAERDVVEVRLDDGAKVLVSDLRRALAEEVPALRLILPHVMFAVNMEYAADHLVVPDGAAVACIPPVSGG
ncbi:MAG TPA: MoaD/ThiS family protein [Pirellulales bacterium]|nr:MoaD/ThiS family protein [Pirellulales bacterium]